MQGELFLETLRRSGRTALYWGLALAFLSFLSMSFLQDMDALKQYEELFKTLPPALLAAFGMNMSESFTPEAFINLAVFARLALLVPIYGILAGLNISSGEEDEGIMDMVLSSPVARWRIIVERFAAFCLLIVLIALLTFAGLLLGIPFITLPMDITKLLQASLNTIPLMVFTLALTALVATLVRRRSIAIGIVAGVVVGSYFLDALGAAASETIMNSLRVFSYFRYYDSQSVMANGLNLVNLSLLLGGALLMIGGAVYRWERRDVGL